MHCRSSTHKEVQSCARGEQVARNNTLHLTRGLSEDSLNLPNSIHLDLDIWKQKLLSHSVSMYSACLGCYLHFHSFNIVAYGQTYLDLSNTIPHDSHLLICVIKLLDA